MSLMQAVDGRRSMVGRRYEPKSLNEKHHEILRLALLGLSNTQIASKLGCTSATVSLVRNSGLGRQQSALLRAEADYSAVETATRIREMAPAAIEAINQIITDEETPASVRLCAAKDVLDRAGYAAPKKVDVRSTSIHLTGEDLEGLKAVALERAKVNGLVLDTPLVGEESASA